MLALLIAAALTCPDDQVIGLDLPAWRAQLLKDAPGSHEQHAEMAALRMQTVPQGTDAEDECIDHPRVEGVDVFEANLTGQHDKLVQVRLRLCKGTPQEWQSLRIALLLPLGGTKWCLFGGDDLSVDQSARNKPCEGAAKLPRTLAFRDAGGRRLIEARDQSGSCEPGEEMSAVTVALYQAQGLSLKKIFENPLLDARRTGSGAMLVEKCEVAYGKEIEVRCGETALRYVYEKGKYVPAK